MYDKTTGLCAGAEYCWRGIAALRVGAKFDRRYGDPALACGAGLKVGRYSLDYGIMTGEVAGYPQSLGLTISF
jgi:hypothetical protein